NSSDQRCIGAFFLFEETNIVAVSSAVYRPLWAGQRNGAHGARGELVTVDSSYSADSCCRIVFPSFCVSPKNFWYSVNSRFNSSDRSGLSFLRRIMSRTRTGLGSVASSVSSSKAVLGL